MMFGEKFFQTDGWLIELLLLLAGYIMLFINENEHATVFIVGALVCARQRILHNDARLP